MPTRSSSRSIISDRRRLLAILALLLALGEVESAFQIHFSQHFLFGTIAASVFAAFFFAARLWIRRGGIGGPLFVGLLCGFELYGFPTWDRSGAADWITQCTFIVIALAGLLVALAVLRRSIGERRTKTTAARLEA